MSKKKTNDNTITVGINTVPSPRQLEKRCASEIALIETTVPQTERPNLSSEENSNQASSPPVCVT